MRYQKKTTAESIKSYFAEIRKSISGMQKSIDHEIEKTLSEIDRQKDRLKESAFEAEKMQLEHGLTSAMGSLHQIAESEVRPYFSLIRDTVQEWSLQKPVPELVDALRLYKDFGITPTAGELSILLDKVNGNYLSMRMLNTVSVSVGIAVSDTPTIDEINRAIDEAESNTISNIFAFCGSLAPDNKIKGVPYMEIDYPWPAIYNASVFLNDDRGTALSRLEQMLAENTETIDTSIQLTPAKRSEIDAYFADCQDEASRIELARKMLEADFAFDGVLRRFDDKLYRAALSAMAEAADAELEEIKRQKELLNADETAEKLKAVNARSALARSAS